MLKEALDVVQKARALDVRFTRKGNRLILERTKPDFIHLLYQLQQSVEAFDRETGTRQAPALDPQSLLLMALGMMRESGLDPSREFGRFLRDEDIDSLQDADLTVSPMMPSPRSEESKVRSAADDQQPEAHPDRNANPSVSRDQGSVPHSPKMPGYSKHPPSKPHKPAAPSPPARVPSSPSVGAEDALHAFHEPEVADGLDHGLMIDAIMDSLSFAVRKRGWTPQLRNLAVAFRKAQQAAGSDNYEMRISKQDWLTLAQSVESAVLEAPSVKPSWNGPKYAYEANALPKLDPQADKKR